MAEASCLLSCCLASACRRRFSWKWELLTDLADLRITCLTSRSENQVSVLHVNRSALGFNV